MSKTLLHLDSSILGPYSVSRTLSASIVARLISIEPDLIVGYRDLAARSLPHLSGAMIAASQSSDIPRDDALQSDLDEGAAVIDEFLAADVVVIGVAFYNFTISSQLKAWIDRIVVAGRTFNYVDGRPVGLAGAKRVVLAVSRGGFYGPGTPASSLEHAETYLRGVFAFLGIPEVEVVLVEGVNVGPEMRQSAIEQAQSHIAEMA